MQIIDLTAESPESKARDAPPRQVLADLDAMSPKPHARGRKRAASTEQKRDVKTKVSASDAKENVCHTTEEDFVEVVEVANNLPTAEVYPSQWAKDVADAIMLRLDVGYDRANFLFDKMELCYNAETKRGENRFATRDTHTIVALPAIPVMPPIEQPLPQLLPEVVYPDNFPKTRGALFSLKSTQLVPLLEFYSLKIEGTVKEKRNRLAEHLGLFTNR